MNDLNNCVRQALAELEAAGLVVKTGEFRRDRLGNLTPVFVAARSLGLIDQAEEERRLKLIEEDRGGPA